MANKFECNPGKSHQDGIYGLNFHDGRVEDRHYLYRVKAAWQEHQPGQEFDRPPTHHFAEAFVLAQSEEDACAQAQCGLRIETMYCPAGNRPVVAGTVTLSAERVPFFIRGWSSQEF